MQCRREIAEIARRRFAIGRQMRAEKAAADGLLSLCLETTEVRLIEQCNSTINEAKLNGHFGTVSERRKNNWKCFAISPCSQFDRLNETSK